MEQNNLEESAVSSAEGAAAKERDYMIPASIIIAALLIAGSWIYTTGVKNAPAEKVVLGSNQSVPAVADLESAVLPANGVVLPAKWGDLGLQMVNAGVIDKAKFEALYEGRGGLDAETKQLLSAAGGGNLKINAQNAGTLLNLLWALGLGNKNAVLDNGPMKDSRYGGAQNFASTAGWTLAQGNAMDHYSHHSFVSLSKDQQDLVERVSKNIYRPCCGNSVYFPDCNHGIAMLGLLELMASQGAGEEDMYKFALKVNSYWFPDTYLTIGRYLHGRGIDWKDADPKNILGANFSSASGYQKILSEVESPESGGGGGCG